MSSLTVAAARVAACVLLGAVAVSAAAEPLNEALPDRPQAERDLALDNEVIATFLDRLMLAESGGRDNAANPRSTALGAFQFIKSTFLHVARRHFADEIAGLADEDILKLRTDRTFSRRAAEAYARDAAAYLKGQGLAATMANLRLAYLVGPNAAARLLEAASSTPAVDILGAKAVEANPFMKQKSAADLIAKAARDVGASVEVVEAPPTPAVPTPAVKKARCRPTLASCRKFIALAENKAKTRKAEKSGTRKQA